MIPNPSGPEAFEFDLRLVKPLIKSVELYGNSDLAPVPRS